MKRTLLRSIAVFTLLLAATSFSADHAFAKGNGGGFGGGGARGFSGGGSRSFSAPRSFTAPSAPNSSKIFSAPAPSMPSKPSTPHFTPGPSEPMSAKSYTPPPPAPKTMINSGAARAERGLESQKAYDAAFPKAESPKPSDSWKSSAPDTASVKNLQKELTYERWQNRQLRQDQMYNQYRYQPTPCCYTGYHDPFNNIFFWMWLMDRPHYRDEWVYHHRNEIDPARYEELKKNDANLEKRLAELEARGVQRDPSYAPPEFKDNKDLVVSDDYAKKAYEEKHSGFPWFLTILGILLVSAVIYFLFVHRYHTRRI